MNLVELGAVCEINNGFAFKSSDFKDRGVPLLRISSFNNGPVNIDNRTVYVDDEYLISKSDFKVEYGDVLIALSGATTGKFGIYNNDTPSLLNQRVGLIKSSGSKRLYHKYFYHYLSVLKDEILRKAGGAAQPNISTKEIGKLQIPLPPLETQKRIAAILDKAQELIDNDKKILEKYDQLAQSVFLDMFGDPVTNPKWWEKSTVDDIASKVTDGEHTTPKRSKQGYMLLSARNIKNGFIDLSVDVDFVEEKEFIRIYKRCNPEKGDILISCSGTIGRVTVNKLDKPFVLVRSAALIKLIKEKVEANYFEYYLRSNYMQAQMKRSSNTSSQANLFTGQIKKLPVLAPPIELQKQFTETIEQIERQKQLTQQSLKKSEELFQSLLQRAFKGELV